MRPRHVVLLAISMLAATFTGLAFSQTTRTITSAPRPISVPVQQTDTSSSTKPKVNSGALQMDAQSSSTCHLPRASNSAARFTNASSTARKSAPA